MKGFQMQNHVNPTSGIKIARAFGLWDSPISPASLAYAVRLNDVAWDTDGETLVWMEARSGRGVLVCTSADGGSPRDLTDDLSVRARVGYGGGDFTVAHGQVIFVEAESGRLYRKPLAGGTTSPVTPGFGECASPTGSPDGRWVLYVHSYERTDALAMVDVEGTHWPRKIAEGHDFYMQPTWHPDGERIAWVAWDHPNMPWDSTQLQMATLSPGPDGFPCVTGIETLEAGPDVTVFQPAFSPDGRLLAYISDAGGWGNLYLYDLQSGEHRALTDEAADHHLPAWIQGMHTYAFSADGGTLYCARNQAGFWRLCALDVAGGQAHPLDTPNRAYTSIEQVAASPNGNYLAFLGSSGRTPTRVVGYDPDGDLLRVWRYSSVEVPPEALSEPEPLTWRSPEGEDVHGLYWPPTSAQFEGIGVPPGVILVHGGPTSQVSAAYNPTAQFLATRGYAVLAVNYRGSTGYGKAYMAALRGNWGVHDVEDSVSGANFLAEAGLADPERLVIMGGSAGGYTVLLAMVRYPTFFRAGVCLYGVSNLFTLAAETHKFEERYLDSIVGPLPEAAATYRQRSPIFEADKIVNPIIIFQGDEDRVVPRNQADTIVESLKRRGVSHEYHIYEGEGHGWRKRETIEHYYQALEAFLRQHVLFA
jgi:dipeptidyl aminopeptidase/acylaminoacyl peptidase